MNINRRHFMQASGLAASAVGISQAATEAVKPVSANDHVQIGCIGFGIMGQGDMKTEASLPGVKIVAVADVYDGRRTLAQERYGKDVFTTRDYRELLGRRDVDAVIVATPDHWHAHVAIDALHAGKDVYCQKPMVREVPDGHRVIEAEKQTGTYSAGRQPACQFGTLRQSQGTHQERQHRPNSLDPGVYKSQLVARSLAIHDSAGRVAADD